VFRYAVADPAQLHASARRALSSSSLSPPLPGFLPTLFRAVKRVWPKVDALSALDATHNVFRSDVRPEQMWWMLLQMHMPQHADVDLAEFLEGVKVAAETQLHAVNSEEFAVYAAGRQDSSEAADALASFCSPRAFKGIKQAAQQMLEERNMLLELQEVAVDAVQVTDIRYAQLTETQFEALMAGLPNLPALWAADASVELLQIQVAMKTTEVTKMTLIGVEEVLAQQTNVRTWTFATRANSNEQLAWSIMDTFAINESATQLSLTVYDEDEHKARKAGVGEDDGQGEDATEQGEQHEGQKQEAEAKSDK
jgi:hypothetical protein